MEEIELPEPGPGEVLVRVHTAAITRDELAWPTDRLPAIPSYELSGVVADGGDEEVVALTPFDRDGVAADYAVVPTTVLAPKPPELSHVEAAALPMGALSGQQGLFVHGELQPGERVLVTGASGGVGHLAVQLARHAGAEVVAEEPFDLVFDTAGADPLPRAEPASQGLGMRKGSPRCSAANASALASCDIQHNLPALASCGDTLERLAGTLERED